MLYAYCYLEVNVPTTNTQHLTFNINHERARCHALPSVKLLYAEWCEIKTNLWE